MTNYRITMLIEDVDTDTLSEDSYEDVTLKEYIENVMCDHFCTTVERVEES